MSSTTTPSAPALGLRHSSPLALPFLPHQGILELPNHSFMELSKIQEYVAGRLAQGAAFDNLQKELLAVGWSEEEASAALKGALVARGVPSPETTAGLALGKKQSTVEIVLNFFSFILLGIVATAVGTLYFQIINTYFPDPLTSRYGYDSGASSEAIHYAIAALVVGFPLYYFSMKWWFRKFREEEGKVESRLTKWLTYLVLLVTAVTIVGDLIAVVFRLLQGEVSARFFLKTLVILVIAGSIFGFYFLERRKIQYHHDVPRNIFQGIGAGTLGLVLLGIVLGFFAGGTPGVERMRTLDEQRSSDLQQLSQCIQDHAREYRRLPASLDELEKGTYSYCAALQDPETFAAYEYRVVNPGVMVNAVKEGEFELCATFATASDQRGANERYYYDQGKWYEHDAGRQCDTATVVLEAPVVQPAPLP